MSPMASPLGREGVVVAQGDEDREENAVKSSRFPN